MSAFGIGEALLLFCIFYEAKGEPIQGKVAVAHVVMNRAQQKGVPVEVVITAKDQFEWYKPGMTFEVDENELSAWVQCEDALRIAIAQRLDGENLQGANHFFNPNIVQPDWAEDMVHVATIDNHSFYRG